MSNSKIEFDYSTENTQRLREKSKRMVKECPKCGDCSMFLTQIDRKVVFQCRTCRFHE